MNGSEPRVVNVPFDAPVGARVQVASHADFDGRCREIEPVLEALLDPPAVPAIAIRGSADAGFELEERLRVRGRRGAAKAIATAAALQNPS